MYGEHGMVRSINKVVFKMNTEVKKKVQNQMVNTTVEILYSSTNFNLHN